MSTPSRCQIEHVTNLLARQLHAAATTSRHICRADALKARCVLAEVSTAENLLPGRPGTVGRNSDRGNRLFVEAVIWKFRAGAPWRDLPERFGGWSNTHRRFSRWAEKGVWENLFKALADDPDNEYAMIDATIVRAHQHSAGARKKGVATRPSAARTAGSRPKSM